MTSNYEEQVLKWRAQRETSLRAENGWLALAGLFWLGPGANTVGSDAACAVGLPEHAPAVLGTLINENEEVVLEVAPGHRVRVEGVSMQGAIPMRPDTDDDPTYVTLDSLRLVLIARPSGIGVRVWDNARSERVNFPPREWFPVNDKYRVSARYLRYPAPKKVLLPDTFGEMREGTMDGQVTFELDGALFDLDVSELEDHRLDIQFRDLTSGKETYPTGRYYYTVDAVVDGKITLDFNFAYNPPCAFTEFATCVFAPEQNALRTRIEAGERFHAH